jgi:hypothetical protein
MQRRAIDQLATALAALMLVTVYVVAHFRLLPLVASVFLVVKQLLLYSFFLTSFIGSSKTYTPDPLNRLHPLAGNRPHPARTSQEEQT